MRDPPSTDGSCASTAHVATPCDAARKGDGQVGRKGALGGGEGRRMTDAGHFAGKAQPDIKAMQDEGCAIRDRLRGVGSFLLVCRLVLNQHRNSHISNGKVRRADAVQPAG